MIEKRWTVLPPSPHATTLHQALGVNPLICNILAARGIETFEAAKKFFRPDVAHLHDPFLMKDMHQAVTRLQQAVENQEPVLVFGDYDVDGTTSVASMYQFLQTVLHQVYYYIPHRYREGYGVSKQGIEFAKAKNCSLIIALDCGTKSVALVNYAKSLGIDFIICDHHLPDDELPDAIALLNPKQADCTYPFKHLCGCGVGFKLMQAVAQTLSLPPQTYLQFLPLVATAIGADIVPVIDENRVLASLGIQQINTQPPPAIKALLELAQYKATVTLTDIVFLVAPRINAAGRMDDASKAVELFIQTDFSAAVEMAKLLQTDNNNRKIEDAAITTEALEMLAEQENLHTKKSIVVYQPHWHKGVVGIVASRLVENYYKPTVVLTQSGEVLAGSARSVIGFNLHDAIHACAPHLITYGGHYAAAGVTLHPHQLDAFKQAFENAVAEQIQPNSLQPEILIDSPLSLHELTSNFFPILQQFEPFGPDNMNPTFLLQNVQDFGKSRIVKEQHIRFDIVQNNYSITGIGFGLAHKFPIIESGQPFQMVAHLQQNEFNGTKSLQLRVLDIKPQ
ncbi:MAG: single-stranded-DNA-specific exonuclease RecJ [Bacteroidetes bacterium]|nr:MAG: single-stranded-DNA-specific exonuclease RecJ [Bacteroidota bacterium]